jgi:hypothetical protein
VHSSLTGTFGGSLTNDAQDRNYPFSYTISSANTWEQKSITISGDVTGTWATDNTCSFKLWFSLGVGSTFQGTANTWGATNYFSTTGETQVVATNGATWYLTGVQLEVGSTATSFDYRPYGTELSLCYRYFQGLTYNGSVDSDGMRLVLAGNGGTNPLGGWQFIVPMRVAPTMTSYGAGTVGGSYNVYSASSTSSQSNWSSTAISYKGIRANYTGVAGSASYWVDCTTGSGGHGWTASAEL